MERYLPVLVSVSCALLWMIVVVPVIYKLQGVSSSAMFFNQLTAQKRILKLPRFIFFYGIVSFGIGIFILSVVYQVLTSKHAPSLTDFGVYLGCSILGGAFAGYLSWSSQGMSRM